MARTNDVATAKEHTRDLTKGSIVRNLLSLSWPMVVTEGLYTVTIAEMIWIGRIGPASVAGVGVAYIILMLVMTVQIGLSVAGRAMVARFIGASDEARANHVAHQALILSATYGLLMMVLGLTLSAPLMGLFRLESDVVSEGATYLKLFSLAWLPVSFWLMAYGLIQASGDAVGPMKIEAVMRLTHLVLTPFLVLGWWVFPRLGVSGAAISSVVIETLGTSLAMWYMLSGKTRLRLTFKDLRPDFHMMWRIVRIGLPACVMNLQSSVSGIIMTGLMVPFGTMAVAGHSLINRIQMIVFLPSYGLSLGAGVLTGQNLGASEPARAERNGWIAAAIAGGFTAAAAFAILLWAETFVGVFSSDVVLVQTTGSFLRIAAAGYLVSGLSIALQQSISGAGDTIVPMLVGILAVWGLQVPLAFILPKTTDWGVDAVRWAMVAPVIVSALVYTAYFRSGRWKRKPV